MLPASHARTHAVDGRNGQKTVDGTDRARSPVRSRVSERMYGGEDVPVAMEFRDGSPADRLCRTFAAEGNLGYLAGALAEVVLAAGAGGLLETLVRTPSLR